MHKQEYFARYGPEQGLLHLAQDFPNPSSPTLHEVTAWPSTTMTISPTSSRRPRKSSPCNELKDGKPDLISFQLKDNTYVVARVVDKGYLRIGKKKLVVARKGK